MTLDNLRVASLSTAASDKGGAEGVTSSIQKAGVGGRQIEVEVGCFGDEGFVDRLVARRRLTLA